MAADSFASLDRAVQNKSPLIAWTKVEPRLDALRGHAKLEGLLRRIGFAAIGNGSG